MPRLSDFQAISGTSGRESLIRAAALALLRTCSWEVPDAAQAVQASPAYPLAHADLKCLRWVLNSKPSRTLLSVSLSLFGRLGLPFAAGLRVQLLHHSLPLSGRPARFVHALLVLQNRLLEDQKVPDGVPEPDPGLEGLGRRCLGLFPLAVAVAADLDEQLEGQGRVVLVVELDVPGEEVPELLHLLVAHSLGFVQDGEHLLQN